MSKQSKRAADAVGIPRPDFNRPRSDYRASGFRQWNITLYAALLLGSWCGVAQACGYGYSCTMGYHAPANNQVTVRGNQFLKDGVPWISKGFTFSG